MRLTYICTQLILSIATECIAQELNVQVVFNNTDDMKTSSEQIANMKELFSSSELINNLRNNPHITGKNLSIRIAFFDQTHIGSLKLKSQHIISEDVYIEKWNERYEATNAVLFLFTKSAGSNQYAFYRMAVSSKLEEEYLLPLVVDFINNKLDGDPEMLLANAAKYLSRILVPVWNDQKMAQAEQLITNNSKYKAGHTNFFHGWFKFGYFNLKPSTQIETAGMTLVNCWSKADMSDKNWFFSNRYIFTSDDYLKGFSSSKVYDWDISFERDQVGGVYIFKDAFLYRILTYVEGLQKHNDNAIASNWSWAINSNTKERYLADFVGFDQRTENDRLILYFDESLNSKEGEAIPKLSGSSTNTWCNIFACDLANEVLFGNIFGDMHRGPWGSNQCANGLHYRISNDTGSFIRVPVSEAWKLVDKGYVVYLSSFHSSMSSELLSSAQVESELCSARSGHIATCFPSENYVIQAGSEVGKIDYLRVFGSTDINQRVIANLYLGYIEH